MIATHPPERRPVTSQLWDCPLHLTPQRKVIADVLQQAGEYPDAPEVLRCADGPKQRVAVVANLDSTRERCVPTIDFDAQYGNDSCRQIIAVTKSNGNWFHGDGSRFLCNPKLDACNFLTAGRAGFGPNRFRSTPGSPAFGKIVSAQAPRLAQLGNKVFFW